MNVHIRLASDKDFEKIQALNHELFISDSSSDPNLNINWPYDAEGAGYFRRMIAGGDGVCFVAERDGRIVGYLAGCLRKPHSAWKIRRTEIENMFVEAEYRSQGIGTKLMAAFFEWSKQKNVSRVLVGAFAPNERAIGFYKQQGFKPYELMLEATLEDEASTDRQ